MAKLYFISRVVHEFYRFDEEAFTVGGCFNAHNHEEEVIDVYSSRRLYSTEKYVTVDTDDCKTDDEIVDLVCDQVGADALEILYVDDEKGEAIYG